MAELPYFNLHKILSYNVPVNVLIGPRGVGKSFSVKDYVINNYLKKGEQFLYFRRYDPELKEIFEEKSKSQKDFFENELKEKYKEHKLEAKNRKFYVDGEIFGIAKRLTQAQDLKSGQYSNFTTIIFDEYPIEKGKRYYLKDEAMVLLGMFDSVLRNKTGGVRIFILGNAVEGLEYSPLFNFFELSLPYNSEIKLFQDNTILVNYMNNSQFAEARQNTIMGRLTKGTRYQDYAFNNKILDKNDDFIEKKTGSAKFNFSLALYGQTYGVWFDFNAGKIYVSNDYVKNSPFHFACTLEDHSVNTMFITSAKNYSAWRVFIQNIKLGNVRYENQKIKHDLQEFIRRIL